MLSQEEVKEKKLREVQAKRNRKAINSAAGMVGWRPHSEHELRQKLADKEHEADAIESAVQRIQELVRGCCCVDATLVDCC